MKYLCYDTALNGEVALIKLLQQYPAYLSLFQGTDDEAIWDAAPFLFEVRNNFYRLHRESPLVKFDRVLIFETREKLLDTVQFLQQFMYTTFNGELMYYRVWDAQVLLNGFKTWDRKKQYTFFEFFDGIYTAAADPLMLDKWVFDGFRLTAEKVLLADVLPDRDPAETDDGDDGEIQEQQPASEIDIFESAGLTQAGSGETGPEAAAPKRRRFFLDENNR